MVDCCQSMVPLEPVRLNKVVSPSQIEVFEAAKVPNCGNGFTVKVAVVEVSLQVANETVFVAIALNVTGVEVYAAVIG